ncbi:hypothetical protein QR77_32290 [Streptomyces sp. 150FB]|uniref:ATP-binding protein n=1 Tax=Streptomyces sp. 150FB TaxID=1576605 RepID=UPI000588EC4F|nr:ATP-binding protein [Streptomyces sp. 150FB]KIF79359.1 hypothetical protein QR77_32290 [Streptomyces sp. 150FB]
MFTPSELVTNTRKYAPGLCLLDLELDETGAEIAVWDTNPALPALHGRGPDRVGKHGLEIILALCESYDVQRESIGKRVKVRIRLTDHSPRRF